MLPATNLVCEPIKPSTSVCREVGGSTHTAGLPANQPQPRISACSHKRHWHLNSMTYLQGS